MNNSKGLSHYLKVWSLSSPAKITKTATGHLYRVDSKWGASVLKIFTEAGQRDEIGGNVFLKNNSGKGTVELYECDDTAQLLEFLPGENLYTFSRNGNEDRATEEFIQIIQKVHSVKIDLDTSNLMTVEKLLNVFHRVTIPSELSRFINRAIDLGDALIATQKNSILLHGDLHHENVIMNKNGDFVCFDPKGIVGDPAYELGTTLKNPWDYPKISQDISLFQQRAKKLSKGLSLDYSRVVEFAYVHICLSICWALEDNCRYDHQLTLAQQIFPILNHL